MDQRDNHKPLFNIRDAARLSGVSANLIRAYERFGLLRPFRDPDNNYRLFTADEIDWIKQVKFLINKIGLNIEGIKCVLTICPCWVTKGCSLQVREKCPAFIKPNMPCWMVEEGPPCCSGTDCFKCPHYIEAKKHPKLMAVKNKKIHEELEK